MSEELDLLRFMAYHYRLDAEDFIKRAEAIEQAMDALMNKELEAIHEKDSECQAETCCCKGKGIRLDV